MKIKGEKNEEKRGKNEEKKGKNEKNDKKTQKKAQIPLLYRDIFLLIKSLYS